ncbi:MAG: MerR family transcriptional regulator [Deltaproteobacteria bacterium]|nr:MerR family transcriptional regulator [Deltaproteobacteria bacterium]
MVIENTQVQIPDKLYFKIGEVAKLVGVKPYVLRYWETEFPEIRPGKSQTNQRLYKRKEVETVFKIKELLYKEKFTISGARKRLKDIERGMVVPEEEAKQMPLFAAPENKDFFVKLKTELNQMLEMIQ